MRRRNYEQQKRFNWILIFAALVMLILFGTGNKPPLERIFNQDPPGTGLALEDIGFSRDQAEGASQLIVRGTVRNVSNRPQVIPGITISLLDEDDGLLASQHLGSMARVIEPDETAAFFTSFEEPPKAAKRVNVTFSDSPDE